jgi:malate dehydrogenase (oxaloacetate-decarboxylating)
MFVYPGMGLGALVGQATKVTAKMFLRASKALSGLVTPEQRKQNMLLPNLKDIRNVSAAVAKAVAIEARDSGIGRLLSDDELERVIKKAQWEPHYYPFKPK